MGVANCIASAFPVASFPVPRRLQYILQATKSWAWDWERGYIPSIPRLAALADFPLLAMGV